MFCMLYWNGVQVVVSIRWLCMLHGHTERTCLTLVGIFWRLWGAPHWKGSLCVILDAFQRQRVHIACLKLSSTVAKRSYHYSITEHPVSNAVYQHGLRLPGKILSIDIRGVRGGMVGGGECVVSLMHTFESFTKSCRRENNYVDTLSFLMWKMTAQTKWFGSNKGNNRANQNFLLSGALWSHLSTKTGSLRERTAFGFISSTWAN